MRSTIISIIIAGSIIAGAIFLTKSAPDASANNVSIVDGVQIVEISAKGGYFPRKSIAKVGIPTILRFNTNGTFDCSASVRIPSMNISKVLPQSGITDIDLGIPDKDIFGTCGMGMYPFEIDLQD